VEGLLRAESLKTVLTLLAAGKGWGAAVKEWWGPIYPFVSMFAGNQSLNRKRGKRGWIFQRMPDR
jgi:hypothetical protein